MKRKVYTRDFLRGLNTTASEDGLQLPEWRRFENIRTDNGDAARRGGMARVDRVPNPATSLDLDGSSEYVRFDGTVDQWALKKFWTLRILCSPDTTSGTQYALGWNHASNWPVAVSFASSAVTAVVTDVDSATTTLTTTTTYSGGDTLAIQVVRNGTALSLWVNGVEEETDTMADKNCYVPAVDGYFGRQQSSSYFDGPIDNVTLLSVARTDQAGCLLRWHDPMSPSLLADYHMEVSEATTARVDDRSPFQNHAIAVGAPSTTDELSIQTTPVRMIHPWLDKDGLSRLGVIAGRKVFLGEVK